MWRLRVRHRLLLLELLRRILLEGVKKKRKNAAINAIHRGVAQSILGASNYAHFWILNYDSNVRRTWQRRTVIVNFNFLAFLLSLFGSGTHIPSFMCSLFRKYDALRAARFDALLPSSRVNESHIIRINYILIIQQHAVHTLFTLLLNEWMNEFMKIINNKMHTSMTIPCQRISQRYCVFMYLDDDVSLKVCYISFLRVLYRTCASFFFGLKQNTAC